MVLNPHKNACCWKPWNLAKIRRNSVFLWENVRRRCPTSCSLQWPRILSKSVEKSVFCTQIHLLVDLRPPVSSILAESPIFDANSPQKILLKFDDVRAGQLCCRCSKVSQSTDVLTRWSTVSQMSWNVVCPIDSTFFPSQAKGPDWIENCRLMMMVNKRWWLRTKGNERVRYRRLTLIFLPFNLRFDWNLMGCFGVDVAFPVAALQRLGWVVNRQG